jgi:hypothetical protein
LPEFPEWNPSAVIFSQNKQFKCKLVDKTNFIFECEKISIPVDASVDGAFCTPAEELKPIINWAKDVKSFYEKNCGPK